MGIDVDSWELPLDIVFICWVRCGMATWWYFITWNSCSFRWIRISVELVRRNIGVWGLGVAFRRLIPLGTGLNFGCPSWFMLSSWSLSAFTIQPTGRNALELFRVLFLCLVISFNELIDASLLQMISQSSSRKLLKNMIFHNFELLHQGLQMVQHARLELENTIALDLVSLGQANVAEANLLEHNLHSFERKWWYL